MNYDIVLMIIEKNMKILNTTISCLRKYVACKEIVLIGKKNLEVECYNNFPDCRFIDEDNLYDGLSYDVVKNLVFQKDKYAVWRSGWYFQQFLKMVYALKCEDTNYLIWDADTIPLRPVQMINCDSGRPYFDIKTEYNRPYFTTLKKLFNPPIKKQVSYSYISEHMLINVEMMKHMIRDIEKNSMLKGRQFFEKIMDAVLEIDVIHSGFSEFETYGNYVSVNYKDCYDIRQLKSLRNGKYYLGNDLNDELLEWAGESYDLISIEERSESNQKIVQDLPRLMQKISLENVVKNESEMFRYD